MNCNTCRYELSQCLDGRLPSGRRAVVLAHAEQCEPCGAFWKELQAAQDLTLSLQQAEVGSDFREGLWERIHAGEGTPDAVFHEPVPTWTKVRYALTGAAAAAAVLIGASFLQPAAPSAPDRVDVAAAATPDVAPVATQPVSRTDTPRLQPRDRGPAPTYTQSALLSNARPLTLQLLANEAASQLEERPGSVHRHAHDARPGEQPRRRRPARDRQRQRAA